ncbi:MAG: hypothetical protein QN178_00865 [Armatimonadota bacterium]|nr:hypothetical protein [Armatimonadota bacterium]
MTTVTTPAERWTTGALVAFWLPLALSWMMMIVAQPIASIAISRLVDPEVHLAAYGVTFDLALLLESPIIMLLSASVALTRDQASYRLLRRLTLWIGGIMTGLYAVAAFTPAYGFIVRGLLGIPDAVAVQAQPALQLLLPWIVAIAWRRFHQGPLILRGDTRLISYGTVLRLLSLTAILAGGVAWPVLPGATLGALALTVSVIVESAVNTVWAMPVVRRLPRASGVSLTMPQIIRFCTPLAATDIIRSVVRPAVAAGISRAVLPQVSLAAWPVAASLISVISSGAMAFQEVTVAVIEDRLTYLRVRRFILGVGAVITLLAMAIVFTPLIRVYLAGVVRLPPTLLPHVVYGMQIMLPLPFLMALRNLFRGVLIQQRSTSPIQLAMIANAAVLVLTLVAGAAAGWTGITVATVATLAAQIAEVLVLFAYSRRAARRLV